MKLDRYAACLAIAAALPLAVMTRARATESAAGHYITGEAGAPGAGIVPPQPGVYWSNVNLYYTASTSSSRQFPVAGNIVSGLKIDFASFGVTALYVPPVKLGPFTIATGLTVAPQYIAGTASVGRFGRSEDSFGYGDMIISPLLLGWNSGPNFVQARLDIFAPTGPYEVGSLANISMNYWTFTPTLAYTRLFPSLGFDASASLGIDFNTRNNATSYHSGALLHFDSALTKKFGASGFSAGVLFAFMEQIQDDSGTLATLLGGFRGQAFALGPLATYEFKLGGMDVNSMLRWAPEFATHNRLAGNSFTLSFAGKF